MNNIYVPCICDMPNSCKNEDQFIELFEKDWADIKTYWRTHLAGKVVKHRNGKEMLYGDKNTYAELLLTYPIPYYIKIVLD